MNCCRDKPWSVNYLATEGPLPRCSSSSFCGLEPGPPLAVVKAVHCTISRQGILGQRTEAHRLHKETDELPEWLPGFRPMSSALSLHIFATSWVSCPSKCCYSDGQEMESMTTVSKHWWHWDHVVYNCLGHELSYRNSHSAIPTKIIGLKG